MLQTLVQGGQSSVDSGLQHGAVSRNTSITRFRKPAIVLAFLLALAALVGAVVARNSTNTNLEVPAAAAQQPAEIKDINAADTKASISSEAGTQENNATGSTNSVKVESSTNNGVTNTKLEVNGKEVPVEPNGTTQVTTDNGNQSVTNVITQTQTGGNGYNFNSSFSSSSSYSSNFQNSVGGP